MRTLISSGMSTYKTKNHLLLKDIYKRFLETSTPITNFKRGPSQEQQKLTLKENVTVVKENGDFWKMRILSRKWER